MKPVRKKARTDHEDKRRKEVIAPRIGDDEVNRNERQDDSSDLEDADDIHPAFFATSAKLSPRKNPTTARNIRRRARKTFGANQTNSRTKTIRDRKSTRLN